MTTREEREMRERAEAHIAKVVKEQKQEDDRKLLQMHLRGEEIAAQAEKELKVVSLRAWQAEGGQAADFEAQWPAFHKELIFKRAQARVLSPTDTIDKSKFRI